MRRAPNKVDAHKGGSTSSQTAGGIRVRVFSSSTIVEAALSLLLRSQGFEIHPGGGRHADIAVVDLRGHRLFDPHLGEIPAVALLDSHDDALLTLRAGFRGYARPDDPPGALVRALLAVYEGEVWGERHVLQGLLKEPGPSEPTTREREVMQLLAGGLSNREISVELGISESTVKAHVSSLLTKFGVSSRLELIATRYGSSESD